MFCLLRRIAEEDCHVDISGFQLLKVKTSEAEW
jgi:hypothetical protein